MMDSGATPARRSRMIVDQLRRSQVYRDYERAFQEATGLPLSLRPVETFDLPHQGNPYENPFCALMASANPTCAGCLQVQRRVEAAADLRPRTLRCAAGLWESAVPIHVGDDLIGFLRTGQVLLHRPSKREFSTIARRLLRWGARDRLPRVEVAYFRTRVLTAAQYGSVLRLLAIFGKHLASLSNQLIIQEKKTESPPVTRAKAFIAEHQAEDLSLSAVARAVNMSAFYFCKTFKQATGLTFTDYLARIRVEKVKSLLLDPHKRISEVAYMAGFQSLSQFNRVFRRVAGEAPTVYRGRMQRSVAA
jgi:AraC-like DNA-binding protein/ligand-binding sensor protein